MSSVYVCEFDGQVIPSDAPYVAIQGVRSITPREGGAATVKDHSKSFYLTFHDGLCAAGWLGRLGVGQRDG